MTSPSTTWKLTLSYDGTHFCGWQVQPGRATIQGTLSDAIFRTTGRRVLPQGSGRTDAGVHALAQVASFVLAAPIPAPNLLRALNRVLPPSIRILAAEPAPPTFHARHSALRKTYEYRIFERHTAATSDRICPPFLAPFVCDCRWPLQLDLMQRAATHLLGTHDFTSFAATDPDLTQRTTDAAAQSTPRVPHLRDGLVVAQVGIACDSARPLPPLLEPSPETGPNPIKTIFTSTLTRENDLLLYRVTASGFLHHMVRNLVGILIEVGRGSLTPDAIPPILAARIRSAAGPTAPARGLFLVSVDYPSEIAPQQPPLSEAQP